MNSYDDKVGYVISVKGSKVSGILTGTGTEKSSNLDTVQFGGFVKMKTPISSVFGMIGAIWITDPAVPPGTGTKMIEIDLLGEVMDSKGSKTSACFQRGVSVYPPLRAEILTVTSDDLALIYARPQVSNVRIGNVHQNRDLPSFVATDCLLGKHFAVLGTTGSGKSCSTALILRAILDKHPNGHVVLLDPHNEYGSAFGDKAELINLANLELPYWLMNFEEAVAAFVTSGGKERETEIAILKDAMLEARCKFLGPNVDNAYVTVDTPVPYRLGEVQRIIGNAMGRLDKTETSLPYLRLQSRIQALSSDQRFAFMFSGVVVRDNMVDILSRILRVPVSSRPATIIDLSGVPSEIVDVVVSVLCRMIFDFAVWSVDAKAVPVLLVCEEAHRYVPRDENLGFAPTRNSISRIAKEGRKYGVSLCLVSQRPSELSATILSQCNTLFALRMSNKHDQEFVRTTLPDGADGLIAALPALHAQEAIVVGEGVTVPMRLRFDTLQESLRPKSGTASFSDAWQTDYIDHWFIEDTVARWRQQKGGEPEAAEVA